MNVTGDRVKQIRIEHDLTGEEFGKILGVTKATVSRWENGDRYPDSDTLSKIATLTNVSVDWLLGRTNNKDGVLKTVNYKNEEYIIELSKRVYPGGLKENELLEKLIIVKKMEEFGINFPKILE